MKHSLGKKIISVALLGATTSLMALYAEHTALYKDPRVMGMGGANVAVGSYSTAVFYNPAGLANIKKDHGFVVDVLGVGLKGSKGFAPFAKDLSNVDSTAPDGGVGEMTSLLNKYSGQNFHVGANNYSSISKNSDAFAWSIGLLGASDLNLMPHGVSTTLDVNARAYGGVVLGVAKPFETEYGRLDVGISLKYVQMKSFSGTLDTTTLINLKDSNDKLTDIRSALNETDETGIGADIGVTYHPWVDNYWHPAVAMSIMNIGSMNMNNAYGGQPMTLNLGASITPEFPVFDKFVFAVDYVDALNNFKYKVATGPTATQYTDNDFMKKLRLGVGMGLLDTSLLSLTLNGGWYMKSYTAGVNIELLLFKLNLATYQEELGTGSVSIPDRRYVVQLGLGW